MRDSRDIATAAMRFEPVPNCGELVLCVEDMRTLLFAFYEEEELHDGLRDLRSAVASLIDGAREEMFEFALNNPPAEYERYDPTRVEDKVVAWHAMIENPEKFSNLILRLSLLRATNMIAEQVKIIRYLESRLALVQRDEGLQQVWQEGFNCGMLAKGMDYKEDDSLSKRTSHVPKR